MKEKIKSNIHGILQGTRRLYDGYNANTLTVLWRNTSLSQNCEDYNLHFERKGLETPYKTVMNPSFITSYKNPEVQQYFSYFRRRVPTYNWTEIFEYMINSIIQPMSSRIYFRSVSDLNSSKRLQIRKLAFQYKKEKFEFTLVSNLGSIEVLDKDNNIIVSLSLAKKFMLELKNFLNKKGNSISRANIPILAEVFADKLIQNLKFTITTDITKVGHIFKPFYNALNRYFLKDYPVKLEVVSNVEETIYPVDISNLSFAETAQEKQAMLQGKIDKFVRTYGPQPEPDTSESVTRSSLDAREFERYWQAVSESPVMQSTGRSRRSGRTASVAGLMSQIDERSRISTSYSSPDASNPVSFTEEEMAAISEIESMLS